jgi:fermentation-respiration switch protein FrsA (DUF1100 family)
LIRFALGAVAALALCLGLLELTRWSARHFLFHGSASAGAAPAGFSARTLRASDGVQVHTLELGVASSPKTIVYFHNNRESAEQSAGIARTLHARGYGVVLVEYRGYGASSAERATEAGLYQDATAVLDSLATRGIGSNQIVLWGVSLGTGVAAELAARGRGAELVLITPYTSIPDIVTSAIPLLPARLLIADRFETLAKAARIQVPTLIVHGDADEIVPYWMGEKLARAIGGARLLRVPGGHHGDLFLRAGDALLREFVRFAG